MKRIQEYITRFRLFEVLTGILIIGSIGVGVMYFDDLRTLLFGNDTVSSRLVQDELIRYAFFFVLFLIVAVGVLLRRMSYFVKVKGFNTILSGIAISTLAITAFVVSAFLVVITERTDIVFDQQLIGGFAFGLVVAILGLIFKYYPIMDRLKKGKPLLEVEATVLWANVLNFLKVLGFIGVLMIITLVIHPNSTTKRVGLILGAGVIASFISTIGSFYIAKVLYRLLELLQRR